MFLGLLASLLTAASIFGVSQMVAEQKNREAARMIVDAQKGVGYAATVTGSMAAIHGRPKGF